MFEAILEENAIRIRIGSELALVNEAVRTCTRFAAALSLDEPIALSLLLRELLVNAVKHGNRCNPSQVVTIDIAREAGDLLRVRVMDEGEGFDHRKLDLSLPSDPAHLHRHGYMLIAALSERLEFNGSGNCVTAWAKPPRQAEAALSGMSSQPMDAWTDPEDIAERVSRLVRKDDGWKGRPYLPYRTTSLQG